MPAGLISRHCLLPRKNLSHVGGRFYFHFLGTRWARRILSRDKLLLKDQPWFDIGLIYNNGNQAILAVEKGDSGNRAFAQAFAAWDKK